MRFEACAYVEALWWALRRDGRAPARRDITAEALAAALPHAFILEAVASRGLKFRLVGSALTHGAGIDLAGMPFTALFADTSFATAKALCQQAVAEQVTLDLSVTSQTGASGRMVILPLWDPHRRLAMGCLECKPEGALILNALTITASRFTTAPVTRLGAAAAGEPMAPALDPATSPTPKPAAESGFAEAPLPFTSQTSSQEKRPDTARPALRIVSSNE